MIVDSDLRDDVKIFGVRKSFLLRATVVTSGSVNSKLLAQSVICDLTIPVWITHTHVCMRMKMCV